MNSELDSKGFVAEKNTFTLTQLLKDIRKNRKFNQAGDMISFTGVVRETSPISSKLVQQIEIQAYKEKADQQLNQICTELIQQYDLIDARVIHYTGVFNVGEDLVHCAIASKHRQEGFQALIRMIEEYKHRAFIFKCEIYVDGTTKWLSTEMIEKTGRE
ncbi:MAG: molybdopterin synthase catalytic subunit [Candidatus Hodarchaeales archaeon]|jgi:molybdopterin synthase catalytic subunit